MTSGGAGPTEESRLIDRLVGPMLMTISATDAANLHTQALGDFTARLRDLSPEEALAAFNRLVWELSHTLAWMSQLAAPENPAQALVQLRALMDHTATLTPLEAARLGETLRARAAK